MPQSDLRQPLVAPASRHQAVERAVHVSLARGHRQESL
jgi:hypothetical protein